MVTTFNRSKCCSITWTQIDLKKIIVAIIANIFYKINKAIIANIVTLLNWERTSVKDTTLHENKMCWTPLCQKTFKGNWSLQAFSWFILCTWPCFLWEWYSPCSINGIALGTEHTSKSRKPIQTHYGKKRNFLIVLIKYFFPSNNQTHALWCCICTNKYLQGMPA